MAEVLGFDALRMAVEQFEATTEPLVDEPDSVDIAHVRDHAFIKRKDGRQRCEQCGRGKLVMVHIGVPPSLNVYGSRGAARAYNELKSRWEGRLGELLAATDLPKGLGYVFAEGQMIFPDRRKRDQGNYRFMVEKALGDALQAGGWLADDSWEHFEFGRLRYAYVKDECATAITLHPSWRPLADDG